MRICTWNINSVRLRIERVADFVARTAPDVLCLQEIKCQQGEFPLDAFRAMGLPHVAIAGQKGMHGVAIASRLPLEIAEPPPLCREGHARCVAARIAGFEVHNLYVPAGADVPDATINPKFGHKLEFLDRMRAHYGARAEAAASPPLVLVGDLNVAPEENDVWSHKQLLDVVSHTPAETDRLKRIIADGGFLDIARARHPPEHKLYTWWSYRALDWRKSNRGRRLDHIWADRAAVSAVQIDTFTIHEAERDGDKPSDHVPVTVSLAS